MENWREIVIAAAKQSGGRRSFLFHFSSPFFQPKYFNVIYTDGAKSPPLLGEKSNELESTFIPQVLRQASIELYQNFSHFPLPFSQVPFFCFIRSCSRCFSLAIFFFYHAFCHFIKISDVEERSIFEYFPNCLKIFEIKLDTGVPLRVLIHPKENGLLLKLFRDF